MDRAVEGRDVIVVRRRTGGDVVLIAVDKLESFVETAHFLRAGKNASRLLTALTRADSQFPEPVSQTDLEQLVGPVRHW
jgi:antitoxin YefM